MSQDEVDIWSELAGLANSETHYAIGWRKRFSACVDFEIFKARFLIPTKEVTHWIYCDKIKTCEYNCPLEIVQDGATYYAVCVEGKIPACKIDREDIRLERFNYGLFHQLIAETLPIDPAVERTANLLTWLLGTFRFGGGIKRRVFLTYVQPGDCASEILRLSLLDPLPVIILLPYDMPIQYDHVQLLRTAQVIRLTIGEFIQIDRFCRMELRPRLPSALQELIASAAEQNDSDISARFEIPAGVGWAAISLHFLDHHTLSCRIGTSAATLSFRELGMVNHRTGDPDANWLLLLALAENDGIWKVEWASPARAEREQQRKRRLSKVMRQFFRIAADPIVFDREKGIYCCQFKLAPESHSTTYHPRKKAR